MKLLSVTPLGRNRDKSRLWIESRRLEALGFPPGTPIAIETRGEELLLRPSVLAENHVSSRRIAGGVRPIIDVANQAYLGRLADYPELKITGWHERLQVAIPPGINAIEMHPITWPQMHGFVRMVVTDILDPVEAPSGLY